MSGFLNSNLTVDYILQSATANTSSVTVNSVTNTTYFTTGTFTLGVSQNALTITFLKNLTYTANPANPFTGLQIVDNTDNLQAVQTENPSNVIGPVTYNVTGQNISINWQGTTVHAGDTITLDFAFTTDTAPVLNPSAVSLGSGVASQSGELVSAFLAGVSGGNGAQGIAITGTSGSGTWYYSTDSGNTWLTLTASDNAAVLLNGGDYIRFAPNPPGAQTVATITYHAWDGSVGAGTTVDLTAANATGGTTAFSTAAATAYEGVNGAIVGPPKITSGGGTASAHYSIVENTTMVGAVTATPPTNGDALHFAIAGGADASDFTIDPHSGVLQFKTAPDSENPTDVSHSGNYQVIIQVTDTKFAFSSTQTIDVTVGDAPGVTIRVGKGNHRIDATHTVHGQPLPTNEDDLIMVTAGPGNNTLHAGAGNDTMTGGLGNDVLVAGAGNDVLSGGWGRNRLIGGTGHDTFVFNSILVAGPNDHAYNFSTIAGFNPTNDVIELSHSIFRAIRLGGLSAHAFEVGVGPQHPADRIVYNPHNGYLFYTSDGNGFLNGIYFGKLSPHLHLTHSDFLIV